MKLRFVFALLAACLVCSKVHADSDYESALQAFQEQKFDASYIYLKNTLQANPKHLPAKLLMGKLLMRNGYYDNAISEFREALNMGADIDLVILPLGNVLLFNYQYQDVIDLGKGQDLSKSSEFEWKMLSATAYSSLGDVAKARAEYQAAIRLLPQSIRAINSLAFLNLADKQYAKAAEQVERSLRLSPGDARSWHLRGKVAEAQLKNNDAIKNYEFALSLSEDDPVIRRSLAYTLIKAERIEEATELTAKILEQTPNDPFSMLLNSWLQSRNDNSELASSILEELSQKLSLLPESQIERENSLLFVSGMSAYVQGNYEKARIDLQRYVDQNRQDLNATSMLAEIYINMGQSELAMHLLERVEQQILSELNIALKLANLYLENNKDFKAEFWLQNLREQYPDNVKVYLMSSKALVSRGKLPQAIALIDEANQRLKSASLLLAKGMLLVQNRQFDQALAVGEQLTKANPRNPDYQNLLAAAYVQIGDYKKAQAALDGLFGIDPTHYAGRFNQAMLFKNQQRYEQAKRILTELVAERAKDYRATLQLALVESQSNAVDAAISRLETLVVMNSQNVPAKRLLFDLYMRSGNFDRALSTVNELLALHALHPDFVLRKAEVLINLRQIDQAKAQLDRLYGLWLNKPEKLYRLSSLQQRITDFAGATTSLQKALSQLPEHLLLNLEYARLNIQVGEIKAAKDVIEQMEKQYGEQANILMLKGDIALSEGNQQVAYQQFAQALKLAADFNLPLIRMYELAKRGVNTQSFKKQLKEMVDLQPGMLWRRKLYADFLLNLHEQEAAKNQYEWLLQQQGLVDDPQIHNNLANIYLPSNITQALIHAKKAYDKGNNDPAILDTYGWVLAKLERYNEALVPLRQAYTINSNDPAIRYHIAYALAGLGRNREAKKELEKALADTTPFTERAEAEALSGRL